jgi:predicted ester cyclase
MSIEQNKAIVREFDECLNRPNWAELVRKFFPTPAAADDFEKMHAEFRAAFPEYHATTVDMIAEGDKVVTRDRVRAVHKAEFAVAELKGIPGSGKTLEWEEVLIYRISGDKIVDGWLLVDGVARLRQLGVLK